MKPHDRGGAAAGSRLAAGNVPEPGGSQPALEARGLRKAFGGVLAVAGVDLSVAEGSLTAIIGPNGAGKTTLFNLVTNLYPPDAGEVRVFGRPARGLRPDQLAQAGLVRTFQAARVFAGLSLLENVLVGGHRACGAPLWQQVLFLRRARQEERSLHERARQLLAIFGLEERSDAPAESQPLGIQKLAELARALMAEPRILLLDEPAAGLNDAETAHLAELLAGIRRAGVTIVLVEHNMPLVMSVADTVVVLDQGRVIACGEPDAVRNDPRVIDAYLGKSEVAL